MGKTQKPEIQLAQFFHRNGCMRLPNETRRQEEGPRKYKKGYEIRLVARNEAELEELGRLLQEAGFKLGRPYQKGKQTVQPIYGRQAIERFRQMMSQVEAAQQAG